MEDGKQREGTMMVVEEVPKGMVKMVPSDNNPIAQLQMKYMELESGFRAWLAKQSMPVEAAVVTATSALQGAAIGGFMGTITNDVSSAFPTPSPTSQSPLNAQALSSLNQAQVFCFFVLSLHVSLPYLLLFVSDDIVFFWEGFYSELFIF